MQVGVAAKCMHTNFGGFCLSSFGDKISLQSKVVKNFIQLESAQKIHASSVMSKEKEQNKRERKKEEVLTCKQGHS